MHCLSALQRFVLQPDAAHVDWPSLQAQFTNALTKLQFLDNFCNGVGGRAAGACCSPVRCAA